MYLDLKFGLNLSLSEITLLFDLSLYLDRTLALRKAKSKVKVAHCLFDDAVGRLLHLFSRWVTRQSHLSTDAAPSWPQCRCQGDCCQWPALKLITRHSAVWQLMIALKKN